MPKVAENKKKSQQNPSKDPLGHQIRFYIQEGGCRITLCRFQNRSTSRGSLDQSEPSPRLPSSGIHTKSGADNL